MQELQGRAALVTGGSRGIGRAICQALADVGMHVAFTYAQNEEAAAETKTDLQQRGAKVMAVRCDVRDRKALQGCFEDIRKNWGDLHLLVNNAGINKPTDFDQLTDEDWDEILGVNLKGPFVVTQEALPFLREGGSVVMIGSVSGQYGGPRTAHYAASKAGLISLGQVIARFTAPKGVRCNTIAAGLIQSEMAAAGLQSAAVKQAAANIPLGALGVPSDVAGTVVFLASDASRYITAQTINVNGGLYF